MINSNLKIEVVPIPETLYISNKSQTMDSGQHNCDVLWRCDVSNHVEGQLSEHKYPEYIIDLKADLLFLISFINMLILIYCVTVLVYILVRM
jgi:hypothetical protein